MLYEKTNSRYKYKFHVQIEKGDFSVFESYPSDRVFSQYIRESIYEHQSHTTFKSIINYFDKNFKKKDLDKAFAKWEEIKDLGIDFNKDFNHGYGINYQGFKLKFNFPFNNFSSLVTFKFSGKFEELEHAIIKYTLENTDLEKTVPAYVILEHKNSYLLENYLEEIKIRHPDMDLGEGLQFLDSSNCPNKDTYSHFISLSSQKGNNLSLDTIKDIFANFPIEYIQKHIINDINPENFITYIPLFLTDKYKFTAEKSEQIFSLLLDKMEQQNFDFSTLKLRDFKDFSSNEKIFNRLIDIGCSYKQDLTTYIYRDRGSDVDKYTSNLLKYKLWDFNTKNDEGLTYIEYFNKKYDSLKDEDKKMFYHDFKQPFKNLISNMLFIQNQENPETKIKLENINFLDSANEIVKTYAYQVLLSNDLVEQEVLNNYFNNDMPNYILDFIINSDNKSYYGPSSIISQDLRQEYFSQNEKEHLIFTNKLNEFKAIDIISIFEKSIQGNKDKNYLSNNVDFYYNFYLNKIEDASKKQNFYFELDDFFETVDFFNSLNTENNNEKEYHSNSLILKILEQICEKEDKSLNALHSGQSMLGGKKEKLTKLEIALQEYRMKKSESEKNLISDSLLEKDIHLNTNNKKRL